MNSCTLKIFYLVFRKNGLLKKYNILSHYMNIDKLICNCHIFMGLDIFVEFIIIYTFDFDEVYSFPSL